MRRGWVDRVLVGAALLLVAAVSAQGIASWLGGGHSKGSVRTTRSRPPSEEAEEGTHQTTITLTMGGATCPLRRLRYEVVAGPALRVSHLGARCEPPYPELSASVHG